MSDFKDYPLPQLYGNCGQGPQDPTKVNWTSVAIYGSITVVTAIVFAIAINQGTKVQIKRYELHSEKMNQRFIEAFERQEERIAKLTEQVTAIAVAKQCPEKEVLEENSNEA